MLPMPFWKLCSQTPGQEILYYFRAVKLPGVVEGPGVGREPCHQIHQITERYLTNYPDIIQITDIRHLKPDMPSQNCASGNFGQTGLGSGFSLNIRIRKNVYLQIISIWVTQYMCLFSKIKRTFELTGVQQDLQVGGLLPAMIIFGLKSPAVVSSISQSMSPLSGSSRYGYNYVQSGAYKEILT